MKSMLAKTLLALGFAVGFAGVSSQALACHSCVRHCHSHVGCYKTYVYKSHCCSGHYHKYVGQKNFEGRPVKCVDGYCSYVLKCSGVHYHHHKLHHPCCS